ncbi:MAG: hypothetical protein NZ578_00345 [Candidatus Binatia bacterium]|nr:hypothetical protein [Candidatus Binatia bacterium]
MARARFFLALCLCCSCAAAAPAATPTGAAPEDGAWKGVTAVVRTVLFLPFKGGVCVAGLLSVPAAYVGSGLTAQVRNDTREIRNHYCSGQYFLSPYWEGKKCE